MFRYVVFFVFASVIFSSCNFEKMQPTLQNVKNIRVIEFTKSNVSIEADMVFNNPNRFSVNLESMDMELFVNNTKVTDIHQTSATSIAAKSNFEIPVRLDYSPLETMTSDPQQLINSFGSVLVTKNADVLIKGTAAFSILGIKIKVPINHTETVKVK